MAAVDVVIAELPKLTGTSANGDTARGEPASWLLSLAEMDRTTVLVGVAGPGVILGLRFLAPAVPGALGRVVAGLANASMLDLGAHGVALVGDVPRGLPAPELPDLDLIGQQYATIGVAALALLPIGFSPATRGHARMASLPHRRRPGVKGPISTPACSSACRCRRAGRRVRSASRPEPRRRSPRWRPGRW